jgi:hypothetical protein
VYTSCIDDLKQQIKSTKAYNNAKANRQKTAAGQNRGGADEHETLVPPSYIAPRSNAMKKKQKKVAMNSFAVVSQLQTAQTVFV